MTDALDQLRLRMKAAAAALDFEEAKRLRDIISLVCGGATLAEAEQADLAGVTRQRPGSMGLGTSQQRMTPPAGWRAPSKPDLMTTKQGKRRKPDRTL